MLTVMLPGEWLSMSAILSATDQRLLPMAESWNGWQWPDAWPSPELTAT